MDDQFDQWQQAQISQPAPVEATTATVTAITTSTTNIQQDLHQNTHSESVVDQYINVNSNTDMNIHNTNVNTITNLDIQAQEEKLEINKELNNQKDAQKDQWGSGFGEMAIGGHVSSHAQQDSIYQNQLNKNVHTHNTIAQINFNTEEVNTQVINNQQQIGVRNETSPKSQPHIELQQPNSPISANKPTTSNKDHPMQLTQMNNNSHADIQLNISSSNNYNYHIDTNNIVYTHKSLELGSYDQGDWTYAGTLANSSGNLGSADRVDTTHNSNIDNHPQAKDNDKHNQQQDQWQQAFVQATPTPMPTQQSSALTSSNNQIEITTTYNNSYIDPTNMSISPDQHIHKQPEYQPNNDVIHNEYNTNIIANNNKVQAQQVAGGYQLSGSVHDINNNNNQAKVEGNKDGDDDDDFGDYEENQSVVIQPNHTAENVNDISINNTNNNNILDNPSQVPQPQTSSPSLQPQSASSREGHQNPPLSQPSPQEPLSHSQIQSQSQIQSLSQSQAQIQQASSPITPITQYQPYKRPQIKVQKPIYSEEDIATANKLIESIPDYSFIRATAFIGS